MAKTKETEEKPAAPAPALEASTPEAEVLPSPPPNPRGAAVALPEKLPAAEPAPVADDVEKRFKTLDDGIRKLAGEKKKADLENERMRQRIAELEAIVAGGEPDPGIEPALSRPRHTEAEQVDSIAAAVVRRLKEDEARARKAKDDADWTAMQADPFYRDNVALVVGYANLYGIPWQEALAKAKEERGAASQYGALGYMPGPAEEESEDPKKAKLTALEQQHVQMLVERMGFKREDAVRETVDKRRRDAERRAAQ